MYRELPMGRGSSLSPKKGSPVRGVVSSDVERSDGASLDIRRALLHQPAGAEARIIDELGLDVPPVDDRGARRQDPWNLRTGEVAHLDDLEATGDAHL
jgi:hypothetical protein